MFEYHPKPGEKEAPWHLRIEVAEMLGVKVWIALIGCNCGCKSVTAVGTLSAKHADADGQLFQDWKKAMSEYLVRWVQAKTGETVVRTDEMPLTPRTDARRN